MVTRLGENILANQDRVIRVLNLFKFADGLTRRMKNVKINKP